MLARHRTQPRLSEQPSASVERHLIMIPRSTPIYGGGKANAPRPAYAERPLSQPELAGHCCRRVDQADDLGGSTYRQQHY